MTDHAPTVDEAFRRAIEQFRSRTAVVDGTRSWTFARLGSTVSRVAGGLKQLGVKPGDRIAIWMPNCFEWVATFFAALRLGAVVVPVNTAFSVEEASYLVQQSGSTVLVAQSRHRDRNYLQESVDLRDSLPHSSLSLVIVGCDSPGGLHSWDELAASEPMEREVAADVTDPTLILYTSGTTGKPKGALHNHGFLEALHSAADTLQLTEGDCVVLYLPLYHVYGLLAGMVMTLINGAKVVLMGQFDATRSLELMEFEEATLVFGIPTTYLDQLALPTIDSYDLSKVRVAFTPFPADLCYRVSRRFGYCLNTYGMTETASVAFLGSPHDPQSISIESAGYPVAGLQARIVDDETGVALSTGEPGELQLRGPSILTQYYESPDETALSFTSDGWFRTGDRAHLDEAGRLHFYGRQKDQLRVGGEMVDPVEIEVVLQGHPAVERAAVVGVADDRLGQVPYAWVQVRRAHKVIPSELAEYVAARLAWFKRPRSISIIEHLPTTASGKVQKFRLIADIGRPEEQTGGAAQVTSS